MNAPAPAASATARRRVLGVTAGAVLAAAAALVLFVLPAEYGIDPVGSGAVLGLLPLAEPAPAGAFVAARARYGSQSRSFELAPFESLEYKYRLEPGDALVFGWHASGELVSELHAEQDGAEPAAARSFRRHRGHEDRGSYRAAFAGWHGWFWENRSLQPVTLVLQSAGFFSAARLYRDGRVIEETLGPVPGGDHAE